MHLWLLLNNSHSILVDKTLNAFLVVLTRLPFSTPLAACVQFENIHRILCKLNNQFLYIEVKLGSRFIDMIEETAKFHRVAKQPQL